MYKNISVTLSIIFLFLIQTSTAQDDDLQTIYFDGYSDGYQITAEADIYSKISRYSKGNKDGCLEVTLRDLRITSIVVDGTLYNENDTFPDIEVPKGAYKGIYKGFSIPLSSNAGIAKIQFEVITPSDVFSTASISENNKQGDCVYFEVSGSGDDAERKWKSALIGNHEILRLEGQEATTLASTIRNYLKIKGNVDKMKGQNGSSEEVQSAEAEKEDAGKESIYEKKQRLEREKSDREYAQRKAREQRQKDFIKRQNEEIEAKEKIYKESVLGATDRLAGAVKSMMDENQAARKKKAEEEYQRNLAREKRLQNNENQAAEKISSFYCAINELIGSVSDRSKCSYRERKNVYRPDDDKKYSLGYTLKNAENRNDEFIYVSFIHLKPIPDKSNNYSFKYNYTQPAKIPVAQINNLSGNSLDKYLQLIEKAIQETLTFGGNGVTFLLFENNNENLNKTLDQIAGLSTLPITTTSNDDLANWEYLNFEKGLDLVDLIKNDHLNKSNDIVLKTKDDEFVFLNDGKFIVLKNYELLNDYLNLGDGEVTRNRPLPKITGDYLEVPDWQRIVMFQFFKFNNIYLNIDGTPYPAVTNYGHKPQSRKKVPLAFWDMGDVSGKANNFLYIYKKADDLYGDPEHLNFQFPIDADAYLHTGKYRPAIGFGTYSTVQDRNYAQIEFKYIGGMDWTAALHVKGLEKVDKVKGILKLRRNSIDYHRRPYNSREPYDLGGWKKTKNDKYLNDSDPTKFIKYRIRDWELTYVYDVLKPRENGAVVWLAVSDGGYNTFFPDKLKSSEAYKAYQNQNAFFESHINGYKEKLNLTDSEDFNLLYNDLLEKNSKIGEFDGAIGYNPSNIMRNLEILNKSQDEISDQDESKEKESWVAHETDDFKIEFPENWELKTNTPDGATFHLYSNNSFIRLEVGEKPETLTYENLLDATGILNGLENTVDDFVVLKNETINKNDKQYIQVIWQGTRAGQTLETEMRFYLTNDQIFAITQTSSVNKTAADQDTIDNVLESFEF